MASPTRKEPGTGCAPPWILPGSGSTLSCSACELCNRPGGVHANWRAFWHRAGGTTLVMAQPLVDTDRTPAPRFLTLDRHIPEAIRQLMDEADGCSSMAFAVGGSSCVRLAIRKAFELEAIDC